MEFVSIWLPALKRKLLKELCYAKAKGLSKRSFPIHFSFGRNSTNEILAQSKEPTMIFKPNYFVSLHNRISYKSLRHLSEYPNFCAKGSDKYSKSFFKILYKKKIFEYGSFFGV